MEYQYNPHCNCNECLSSSQSTLPLAPQAQFSEDAVVIFTEQQHVNHVYQRYAIPIPDGLSFAQQNPRSLSNDGGDQRIDSGVPSNEYDPSTPDIQTGVGALPERALNPEAPSFVFVAPKHGNGLNPEAPQFVPMSNKSSISLKPGAEAFVPSTTITTQLDPEVPVFLPALTISDTQLMPEAGENVDEAALEDSEEEDSERPSEDSEELEEESEELDEESDAEFEGLSEEEARFMAASQLSPEDVARRPLLWPPRFGFHHINYFGHTVHAKSYTTPAATLAVLKSYGKYRAAKYAENLRLHCLHGQACQWLDPLVFTGRAGALWHLEATKLQDAATGACFKLYHSDGDWKADSWDEDDDYPVQDPVDPDAYTPGHIIINGRFHQPFLDRSDHITQLNSEFARFNSRQEEKRRKIQLTKAAPKSVAATSVTLGGLDEANDEFSNAKVDEPLPTSEAETSNDDSFPAEVEVSNQPTIVNWADISDDEEDQPSMVTDESWKDRLLPPQDDQEQPLLSGSPLAFEPEPVQQDQAEKSLEFHFTETKSFRLPLLGPILPMISEEDCEEDSERTSLIESDQSKNVLVHKISVEQSEAVVAHNQTSRVATLSKDELPIDDMTDITGTSTNSLELRRKPVHQQPPYNSFNDFNTAKPASSKANHVDSLVTSEVTESTTTTSDFPTTDLAARSSTTSTSSRPKNPSRAGKKKSVRFASPIVAAAPPRVLRAFATSPLVPMASLAANATSVISRSQTSASASLTPIKEPSPNKASESLAPVPVLPTFTSIRPRRSWFPRLSRSRNSGPTAAATMNGPITTEVVSRDISLAPAHHGAKDHHPSRRRRCLLKAFHQLWKTFRGFLSTKQRLE